MAFVFSLKTLDMQYLVQTEMLLFIECDGLKGSPVLTSIFVHYCTGCVFPWNILHVCDLVLTSIWVIRLNPGAPNHHNPSFCCIRVFIWDQTVVEISYGEGAFPGHIPARWLISRGKFRIPHVICHVNPMSLMKYGCICMKIMRLRGFHSKSRSVMKGFWMSKRRLSLQSAAD